MKFIFHLKIVHTMLHNHKVKNQKYDMDVHVCIHSLCSVLCWSTFGSNCSLKSFSVWCYKLAHLFLRSFSHSSYRIAQAPTGWSVGSLLFSNPFSFNRIKVWALAGPLTQSYSFVMEAVFRVVVLLEDESTLSLRSRPLWLSSGMALYIDTFIFPSTGLPVPAA